VGYGFTAIIVAFLGRLHPFGILLAGLLLALTYIGGEMATTQLGLPAATVQLFQGMLLSSSLPWTARPVRLRWTRRPRVVAADRRGRPHMTTDPDALGTFRRSPCPGR
jgi:simple sugar transport system permease protein